MKAQIAICMMATTVAMGQQGGNWTLQFPPHPPIGSAAVMAYDSGHGQVVAFGFDGSIPETWLWDQPVIVTVAQSSSKFCLLTGGVRGCAGSAPANCKHVDFLIHAEGS